MDPAHFARRVMRAIDRGRGIIIEPRRWRLLWYLDRISPTLGAMISEAELGWLRRELERDAGP